MKCKKNVIGVFRKTCSRHYDKVVHKGAHVFYFVVWVAQILFSLTPIPLDHYRANAHSDSIFEDRL